MKKKKDFIENIDGNKIANLENELMFLLSSVMSQISVNKLFKHMNEILLESAGNVVGTITNINTKVKKKSKPSWFDKKMLGA